MPPPRSDRLEDALHRIFEGGKNTRASWFALTGGETLFAEGDTADILYLVRSGRLGVFRRDADGDRPPQFVGVIRPGEPVGEMAMLAGTTHTADVVALRDTEVLALPRDAFFEAARTEPDLMVELSRLMIQRARDRRSGGGEPSVFGFLSARPRPIRAFVERIAAAIEADGCSCQVIDQSALSSAAEWFSRVEDAHDYVLYAAEPLAGRGQGRLVDDLAGEAVGLDGGGDALDEGADGARPGREEAEHAGLAAPGATVAGALDHQTRQFDHQVGLGAGGLEEGVAGEGQHLGIAQGDDIGGVGGPGQHGHLAGRLAGADDADELGRAVAVGVASEHAQPA